MKISLLNQLVKKNIKHRKSQSLKRKFNRLSKIIPQT